MYQFKSRVRFSECNAKAQITVPALVNYFQDCCTFQSEDLGVGLDYLQENHVAWMLSSWQIEVKRYPHLGENIIINTWPYDFKGFYGYRNFTMQDEDGNVIAFANSIWIFIDTKSGRPQKVSDKMLSAYSFDEPYQMEKSGRKMKLPDQMEGKETFPVQKFHIDTNHHVNNEKYIEMALEYVKEQAKVESIQVEYKKAAVLGDIIYPYVWENGEKVIVALSDERQKPYAIVEFGIC